MYLYNDHNHDLKAGGSHTFIQTYAIRNGNNAEMVFNSNHFRLDKGDNITFTMPVQIRPLNELFNQIKFEMRADCEGASHNSSDWSSNTINLLPSRIVEYKQTRVCQNRYSSASCNIKLDVYSRVTGYLDLYVFPKDIKIAYKSGGRLFLPSEDKIEIAAPEGYGTSVYKWVYKTSEYGTWIPIDNQPLNGTPTVKLSGKDIYGPDWENKMNIGGNTWIALEYDIYQNNSNPKVKEYSNVLELENQKSAPYIESVTVVNPTCSGYTDGTMTVQLSRALESDERLACDYSNGTINNVVLEAGNKFVIKGVKAGTQNIRLQGYYNNVNSLYSDGDRHKKNGIVIDQPSLLTFASTKTDILCHDYHTGMVELNVSGGNDAAGAPGGIQYYLHWREGDKAWPSDSIPFGMNQSQITMNGLPHGDYKFFVTDYKGCFMKTPANQTKESTEQRQEITQPETPVTVTLTDSLRPSGYGLSNGYLKMNVVGGIRSSEVQRYTVTWNNKKTGQQLKQEVLNDMPDFEILNIPAGTYRLKVETAHCDTLLEYSLGQAAPLIIDISQSAPILCNGDVNATLTAQARGGVLFDDRDYDYEWYSVGGDDRITGGALSFTNKLENIGKGKYLVKAIDKSRIPNDTIQTILVTQPDSVAFSITNYIHVSCHSGNDASITIQATGGVGRYKVNYRLREDPSVHNMIPFGAGNNSLTISNLIAGTYVIRIVDGNDCTGYYNKTDDFYEVTIKQPEELVIAPDKFKNPSGFGLSNGSVTYRISGGTFTSPSSPSYTVEITDSLSNIIPNTTAIDGQSLLVTANNLPKGRYTISVKDANFVPGGLAGCINTYTVRLTEPELLTVKLDITSTVDCYGFNTGTIEATVKGGHSNPDPMQQSYIYKWVKVNGGTEQDQPFPGTVASGLLAGTYKVYVTDYSDPANEISGQVEIEQPPLLVTALSTRNVSCFSGNDGFIHISVDGGVAGYRLFCKQTGVDRAEAEYPIEADNRTFKLDRLVAGKYEIRINDANGCYAQIQGQDITTIEIKQPDKALEIVQMSQIAPSGFGRSDGSITLHINGGTPNADNSYNLTWKNADGQIIPAAADGNFYDGKFVTTLANQPDGTYTVEVRDNNYNIAYPDANTCCFVIGTYSLIQPKKLVVEIEETRYVSCNGRSDGELAAHVKGGIRNPDTGKLPYKYQWYKEDTNNYIALPNETDSILKNRGTGNYKIEVEDYSRIVNRTSMTYLLVEPEILKATSTQELITCGRTIDVVALPTGGTLPYRYEWNTGETSQTLKDRHPGKYFAFITDSRGCETTVMSRIATPSDLEVSGTYKDPVCYQASNGSITLTVKGGTAPYTYMWNNGATTKDLTNIGAGHYTVIVTDKDGCSYSESFILEDPKELTVNIGEDRTLCNGQELIITPEVEDPKTKFNWTSTNGFTSTKPSATIKEAGEYFLTITDSKGCTASDKMKLYVSYADISSEIVVASQVFVNDTIAIVNISHPEPDRTEWIFRKDDRVRIVQEEQHFARLIFTETGQYDIGIRTYAGDCYQDIIKTITVVEQDDILNDKFKESLIREFVIAPNPNDGNFQAIVKLNRESAIRLRIISFSNGLTVSDRSFNGQEEYRIGYSMSVTPGNLYLVLLETSAGQTVFKMLGK
jgi:hypothetical protein